MALMISELIHPTAVIDPDAQLADDVQVGPYAIIEGPVEIGPGCVIEAHACLNGPLVMGSNNFVGYGAVLGKSPQHRGYNGESTSVRIGDRNVFREFVTVHRGTLQGTGVTEIGDDNMFMIGSHLGHDVQVGNGCTVVNNALVAGHVDAPRRVHSLRSHGRPAAGSRRAAGDARRHGSHVQGHSSLHPPARTELRHRVERDRSATRGLLDRRRSTPCASASGSSTAKDALRARPSSESKATWDRSPRSPSSSPSFASPRSGSIPPRSVDRAQRNL